MSRDRTRGELVTASAVVDKVVQWKPQVVPYYSPSLDSSLNRGGNAQSSKTPDTYAQRRKRRKDVEWRVHHSKWVPGPAWRAGDEESVVHKLQNQVVRVTTPQQGKQVIMCHLSKLEFSEEREQMWIKRRVMKSRMYRCESFLCYSLVKQYNDEKGKFECKRVAHAACTLKMFSATGRWAQVMNTSCWKPGLGHGKALWEQVEAILKLNEFECVVLYPVSSAEGFWKRMGFSTTTNYLQDSEIPLIIKEVNSDNQLLPLWQKSFRRKELPPASRVSQDRLRDMGGQPAVDEYLRRKQKAAEEALLSSAAETCNEDSAPPDDSLPTPSTRTPGASPHWTSSAENSQLVREASPNSNPGHNGACSKHLGGSKRGGIDADEAADVNMQKADQSAQHDDIKRRFLAGKKEPQLKARLQRPGEASKERCQRGHIMGTDRTLQPGDPLTRFCSMCHRSSVLLAPSVHVWRRCITCDVDLCDFCWSAQQEEEAIRKEEERDREEKAMQREEWRTRACLELTDDQRSHARGQAKAEQAEEEAEGYEKTPIGDPNELSIEEIQTTVQEWTAFRGSSIYTSSGPDPRSPSVYIQMMTSTKPWTLKEGARDRRRINRWAKEAAEWQRFARQDEEQEKSGSRDVAQKPGSFRARWKRPVAPRPKEEQDDSMGNSTLGPRHKSSSSSSRPSSLTSPKTKRRRAGISDVKGEAAAEAPKSASASNKDKEDEKAEDKASRQVSTSESILHKEQPSLSPSQMPPPAVPPRGRERRLHAGAIRRLDDSHEANGADGTEADGGQNPVVDLASEDLAAINAHPGQQGLQPFTQAAALASSRRQQVAEGEAARVRESLHRIRSELVCCAGRLSVSRVQVLHNIITQGLTPAAAGGDRPTFNPVADEDPRGTFPTGAPTSLVESYDHKLHEHLHNFFKKNPHIKNPFKRKSPQGIYELQFGIRALWRQVQLFWKPSTIAGERGFLMVDDGELIVPFAQYIQAYERRAAAVNHAYEVRSSIQQAAREEFLQKSEAPPQLSRSSSSAFASKDRHGEGENARMDEDQKAVEEQPEEESKVGIRKEEKKKEEEQKDVAGIDAANVANSSGSCASTNSGAANAVNCRIDWRRPLSEGDIAVISDLNGRDQVQNGCLVTVVQRLRDELCVKVDLDGVVTQVRKENLRRCVPEVNASLIRPGARVVLRGLSWLMQANGHIGTVLDVDSKCAKVLLDIKGGRKGPTIRLSKESVLVVGEVDLASLSTLSGDSTPMSAKEFINLLAAESFPSPEERTRPARRFSDLERTHVEQAGVFRKEFRAYVANLERRERRLETLQSETKEEVENARTQALAEARSKRNQASNARLPGTVLRLQKRMNRRIGEEVRRRMEKQGKSRNQSEDHGRTTDPLCQPASSATRENSAQNSGLPNSSHQASVQQAQFHSALLQEVAELKAKNEKLRKDNAKLQAENTPQPKTVQLPMESPELQAQRTELQAEKSQLKEQQEQLGRKDVEIKAKEAELEKKEAELKTKAAELKKKQEEVSNTMKPNRDQHRREQLEKKDVELKAKEAELESKEAELKTKDAELKRKEEEMGKTMKVEEDAQGHIAAKAAAADARARTLEMELGHLRASNSEALLAQRLTVLQDENARLGKLLLDHKHALVGSSPAKSNTTSNEEFSPSLDGRSCSRSRSPRGKIKIEHDKVKEEQGLEPRPSAASTGFITPSRQISSSSYRPSITGGQLEAVKARSSSPGSLGIAATGPCELTGRSQPSSVPQSSRPLKEKQLQQPEAGVKSRRSSNAQALRAPTDEGVKPRRNSTAQALRAPADEGRKSDRLRDAQRRQSGIGENAAKEATRFAVGDMVEFWSNRYKKWVPMTVIRHILDPKTGSLKFYALNKKDKANPADVYPLGTYLRTPL